MSKQKTAIAETLMEAAAQYVASLGPGAAQEAQPPIYRFLQWFGANRPPSELRSVDVERFAEESAGRGGSQGRNVEAVRPFLAYLKKVGLTSTNLGTAIKLRRIDSGGATLLDPNAIQMTQQGYEMLQRELALQKAKRPQIADALRLAMEDKDFRENAPLDAARDEQAKIEAQIRKLEEQIKNAVIVEGASGATGAARVGSKLVVVNVETQREIHYQLVSPSEVNPREGKISVQSPVGKALVDRAPGDEVQVNVPAGVVRLRVETVEG